MPITFSALVYMGAPISQCGAWSRRPSTHKVVVLSSSPACCMFEEVQVSFREKNTRGWFGVYFSNAARRSGLRLLYVINFVPDSFFFFHAFTRLRLLIAREPNFFQTNSLFFLIFVLA